MPLETLFGVFNFDDHVYVYDLTTRESVALLFDVDDERFFIVNYRTDIDDNTGPAQYICTSYSFRGYAFSKKVPEKKTAQAHQMAYGKADRPDIPSGTNPDFELEMGNQSHHISEKLDEIIKKICECTGISEPRRCEAIDIPSGRVYISEGNLVLERG